MIKSKKPHHYTFRYTLFGVAFGLCFPLLSWAMDALVFRGLSLNFQNIWQLHLVNPLHFIIDTAPFFLGISFGYAGIKQDEVAQRSAALFQTNLVKDKMLSIISHDLRSPLTSLAGTLQLMQQGILQEEEQSMLLSRVTADVHYTNELLDNLLSWASSKETGAGYRPEKFYLMPVVNNVIALFHSMAKDKMITIKNFIEADHRVLADQNMIMLVLRNLISNALKFTTQGGIVSVHSEPTENRLGVFIRDNGVGMCAEKINNLLNPEKSPVSTPGTSNEKGSGIGLMLCKEFIERHGSAMAISSIPGKGSTFSFHLPSEN